VRIRIKLVKAMLIGVIAMIGFLPGFAAEKKMADLIVKGDYLVSMVPGSAVLQKGAVVVTDGAIIALGEEDDILSHYSASEVISGEGRVLMPGLINAHTHSAMTLFRGTADDHELMTWLQKYVVPLEAKFVNPEFVKIGTDLACLEMIETGTTNIVDMYFYPEVIAEAVDRCGIRATIGAPSIDFPSPGFNGWDDSFAGAKKFVGDWLGKHDRIRPAVYEHSQPKSELLKLPSPSAPYSCRPSWQVLALE